MLQPISHSAKPRAQPPRLFTPCSDSFGQFLMDRDVVTAAELLQARGERLGHSLSLFEVLITLFPQGSDAILQGYADWFDLDLAMAPIPHLSRSALADLDACAFVTLQILPVSMGGDTCRLAIADPEQAPIDLLAQLGLEGVQVDWVLAPPDHIAAQLTKMFALRLGHAASLRVDLNDSCRRWSLRPNRRVAGFALAVLAIGVAALFWPVPLMLGLTAWSLLTLWAIMGLKLAALLAYCTRPRPSPQPAIDARRLPRISILVPLYKEPEVAAQLMRNLSQLTYPRCLLDIHPLLEEEDHVTQNALNAADLPPTFKPIIAPDGTPRTKPRAMNYALDFCRGDIIGIYDAEDAPDPDQLMQVAAAFANAPPEVAGFQGVLDYYNPRQNWLARCFTIEYASWFRVILPGMVRLGLAIPLGGTTIFCRRDVLVKLGGWDAHNVTEDADLGLRLARRGYRVDMLDSTTGEEANCHLIPWVKQRSRWLKGYLITYLVHVHHPGALLRDLGLRRFLGVQAHFMAALSQVILAPFLWSFWLIPLGIPHPMAQALPPKTLWFLALSFLMAEALTMTVGWVATRGKAHRHLMGWVPGLHLYFPLAALAAYKALYEVVFKPFYWDKTVHGLSHRDPPKPGHTAGSTQPVLTR